jgi:hypothetical protein
MQRKQQEELEALKKSQEEKIKVYEKKQHEQDNLISFLLRKHATRTNIILDDTVGACINLVSSCLVISNFTLQTLLSFHIPFNVRWYLVVSYIYIVVLLQLSICFCIY